MKILIIAIITLTSGGIVEIVAPSMETCEAWTRAAKTAHEFTITDEGGIVETVAAVECKAENVNTPDAGEEGEWIDA